MDNATEGRCEYDITGYSDTGFAASKDERKSMTGEIVINGILTNWICKKQDGVSMPTMESEIYAASKVEIEMQGQYESLSEIGLMMAKPMIIFVNNQGAIKAISENVGCSRLKLIDI